MSGNKYKTENNENMEFLTDEKLLIVGAGGMIGSNMAQTAIRSEERRVGKECRPECRSRWATVQ